MKKVTIVAIVLVAAGLLSAGTVLYLNHRGSGTADSSVEEMPAFSSGSSVINQSNKNLEQFPKDILEDTGITEINFSYNKLTGALPAEIRKLKNLEILDVSHNNMTGIPAEIGQLGKLRILNYSYNEITGLPMELGNLTKLEQLDLRGNDVSQADLQTIRQKLTGTTILTD